MIAVEFELTIVANADSTETSSPCVAIAILPSNAVDLFSKYISIFLSALRKHVKLVIYLNRFRYDNGTKTSCNGTIFSIFRVKIFA